MHRVIDKKNDKFIFRSFLALPGAINQILNTKIEQIKKKLRNRRETRRWSCRALREFKEKGNDHNVKWQSNVK